MGSDPIRSDDAPRGPRARRQDWCAPAPPAAVRLLARAADLRPDRSPPVRDPLLRLRPVRLAGNQRVDHHVRRLSNTRMTLTSVIWSQLLDLPGPVHDRHRHRFRGAALAAGAHPRASRQMGPRRPALRHARHLVPPRRRPLHGVHLYRGAGTDLQQGRDHGLFAIPYTIIVYPLRPAADATALADRP